jgi:predicted GNAT family acetyltransferase
MGWCTTSDLDDFLAAAGDYLRARPAENTLLLTTAESLRAAGQEPPGSLFGWWEPRSGEVRGAFMHVPPGPLVLAGLSPEAAAALAGVLARQPGSVRGVDASAEAADAFAAAWRQRTGLIGRVHEHSRLYRLASAVPEYPGPVGLARVATADDRDLLVAWLRAFGREIGELTGTPEATADDLLSYSGATFWETDDGPVSMATLTRPVARTVRVSMVYTPPGLRHHGYAAAVTLAVSRAALADGASEVLMITNLASSVSGTLRLGYQPIGERVVLSFGPPTGPQPRHPTGPQPRFPTGPLPRYPTGPQPKYRGGSPGTGSMRTFGSDPH